MKVGTRDDGTKIVEDDQLKLRHAQGVPTEAWLRSEQGLTGMKSIEPQVGVEDL